MVGGLPACIHTIFAHGAYGGQVRVLGFLELELLGAVGRHWELNHSPQEEQSVLSTVSRVHTF